MKNGGQGDVGASRQIFEAIQKLAMYNMADRDTGQWYSNAHIAGYVAKINTDGELAGTIDVQEYGKGGNGYHEGVYLTAIQDNEAGIVIVPKLYSEVIIVADATIHREFVVLYSHADMIRMQSHADVSMMAVETESYEDSGGTDMDSLDETGNKAGVEATVTDSPKVTVTAGDSDDHEGKIEVTPGKVNIQGDEKHAVAVDEKEIVLTSDKVKIGDANASHPAVLGDELGNILGQILGLMANIVTTTQIGPQPPMNLAQIIQLKVQVEGWTAAVEKYLTKNITLGN